LIAQNQSKIKFLIQLISQNISDKGLKSTDEQEDWDNQSKLLVTIRKYQWDQIQIFQRDTWST